MKTETNTTKPVALSLGSLIEVSDSRLVSALAADTTSLLQNLLQISQSEMAGWGQQSNPNQVSVSLLQKFTCESCVQDFPVQNVQEDSVSCISFSPVSNFFVAGFALLRLDKLLAGLGTRRSGAGRYSRMAKACQRPC